jgi:hypothetical protein
MPWTAMLRLFRQGGPQLLKALPKLWPILADPKSREALLGAARDAASRSPSRQLRGRVNGTAAVARGLSDDTADESERELAQAWERRAKSLERMLDLPAADRASASSRRKAVKTQLIELQAEMAAHLGGSDSTRTE